MKNSTGSKRIISIMLIAFLLLSLLTTKQYAATNDSFDTTINTNASQVKREETITITIGLKNIAIVSGEKGIGAYTAKVEFDPSVLEYVSTNGTDKWEAPFYENGLITGNTKDAKVVNTAQNIGTITFKVKKDAKLGETTIGLTNFSGSTVTDDVVTTNKSIKVTIIDNNSNNNTNNNSNNNSNNNNNGNNGSNSNNNNANSNKTTNTSINTTSNKKENMKSGTLPKAGVEDIMIFTVIGICILIAIIFFIRIRLINKKMKQF